MIESPNRVVKKPAPGFRVRGTLIQGSLTRFSKGRNRCLISGADGPLLKGFPLAARRFDRDKLRRRRLYGALSRSLLGSRAFETNASSDLHFSLSPFLSFSLLLSSSSRGSKESSLSLSLSLRTIARYDPLI